MTSCRAVEWRHMKPAATFSFFFSGLFGRLEHPADARRVDRERLLHEDVDALADGVLEMRRAEGGLRGQEHDVAGPEAVDRLAVGVEPDEAPLGRHVDLVLERFEVLEARLDAVLEQVGHGVELDRAAGGREGVGQRARAPRAGADNGQLDRVVFGRVDPGHGHARHGRSRHRRRPRPSENHAAKATGRCFSFIVEPFR